MDFNITNKTICLCGKRHSGKSELINGIFGPWARKPFFSHGKQGRNENEEIRTFSHEGFAFRFSSRGLRPSVEINGMQCPELKNVRFPHSHFDPVFHGKKAFGSEARIRLFYWGAKI